MSHNIDKLKFTLLEGDLEVLKFNLCPEGITERVRNEAWRVFHECHVFMDNLKHPLMIYYSKPKHRLDFLGYCCIEINPSKLKLNLYDLISWIKTGANPATAHITRIDYKVDRPGNIDDMRMGIIIPGKGEGSYRNKYFRIGSGEDCYALYTKNPIITSGDFDLTTPVEPQHVRIERRQQHRKVKFETLGELINLPDYCPFSKIIFGSIKPTSLPLIERKGFVKPISLHDVYVNYGSGRNRWRDFGKHLNRRSIGHELNDIFQEEVRAFVGDPNKVVQLLGDNNLNLHLNQANTINSTFLLS